MQPSRRSGCAKVASLERLWNNFFEDTSQWWDMRRNKVNSKAPDFKHKVTKDLLWLDNFQNPIWVSKMLEKSDKEKSRKLFSDESASKARTNNDVWKMMTLGEALSRIETLAQNELSVESLANLVLKCTKERNPDYAARIHAFLRKNGLEDHPSLANFLVPMFIETGNLQDAQKLFDRLAYPNEHSWSYLINGYIKGGNVQHAYTLYEKMKKARLQPNGSTYVALLKSCGNTKDLSRGLELHKDVEKEGLLENNVYIGSGLIDMYVKCGLLQKAQEVFDKCTVRNVVLWNALIAGYAHYERANEALECFGQMLHEGITPTPITLTCILKACGNIGAKDIGQQIHQEIEKQRLLENDLLLGNALVDMYAKCGLLSKARQVFDKLQNPDVVSWTALISGYLKHEHAEEALQCFERMQNNGITPNAVTYACSLKACGNIEATQKGQEIHAEVVMKGFLVKDLILSSALVDMYAKCSLIQEARVEFDKIEARDVVLWNALISGYVKVENGKEALKCYEQMRCDSCVPDAITYACALKACAITGATEKGAKLHLDVERCGLLGEVQVGNALVDMYAKCGLPSKAEKVFNKLEVKGLVAWTALIAAYAQVGEISKVLSTFERMMVEGVKPDLITFVSVLNACSQTGLAEKAEQYFETMVNEYGIVPSLEHYTCLIDLLGRSGRLDSAIAVIKKMPLYPNLVVWHTVLGACRKWGNIEYGKVAFEEAVHLDPLDASAYVCMSNIYADAGMEESAKIVEAMRVKNQARHIETN